MISIFNLDAKPKASKRSSKKRIKKDRVEQSKAGEDNLAKLNPMSFGILAVKSQENPHNEFLSSSLSVISERPYALTDKWINSINKFVDSIIEATLLDPPSCREGDRLSFDELVVAKVVSPKRDTEYPMPALICVDSRGWKFYFKTSKAFSYKAGDTISFTATVSSHKEGITFLRRPSKIRAIDSTFQGKE